jgi:hypothetical protein
VTGLVGRRTAGYDHRQVLFPVAIEVSEHGLELGDELEARAELALDGQADALSDFGWRRRRGLRQQTAGNDREQCA